MQQIISKKLLLWVGVVFIVYLLISLNAHRDLSRKIHMETKWDKEFNSSRQEMITRWHGFDQSWNQKVKAMNEALEEQQEAFEGKKGEVADSFAETKRRFQEKFDQIRNEAEREKVYPMSQKIQDMADQWDVQAKKNWEKSKKEIFSR